MLKVVTRTSHMQGEAVRESHLDASVKRTGLDFSKLVKITRLC